MAPRQKFSKEEVLNTAFRLVREQGVEMLNARNIAKLLDSSTQPIFSYYENMADLKTDVFLMVKEFHSRCLNDVETDENLLLNIGMAYIDFAIEEPNLFKMMFMSNGFSGIKIGDFFTAFDDGCNEHLELAISKTFDLKLPEIYSMFIDIWLYAHGIASMLAMNQLPTPRSEIESMVKNMYNLLVKQATRR